MREDWAMVDIHTIISEHRSKRERRSKDPETGQAKRRRAPTTSEIPDLFFDDILVLFKLTRMEVMILMYLYRGVWCRPNPYKEFGISKLLSHTEMSKALQMHIDDIHSGLRRLEECGFISTIRLGQYFVRKYFTKEYDEKFGQNYNDFDT